MPPPGAEAFQRTFGGETLAIDTGFSPPALPLPVLLCKMPRSRAELFGNDTGRIAMARITLTGTLTCPNEDDADAVARYVQEHIDLSRAEAGCEKFDITPTDDPLVWQVDEIWTDRPAYEAHQARTRGSVWFIISRDVRRDFELTEG